MHHRICILALSDMHFILYNKYLRYLYLLQVSIVCFLYLHKYLIVLVRYCECSCRLCISLYLLRRHLPFIISDMHFILYNKYLRYLYNIKLEVKQKLERELMTRLEKLEQKEHAIANAQQRNKERRWKRCLRSRD